MATRFFISSHRNCRRFLAVTHHAAIPNNYSHDLQALHFTVERGGEDATSVSGIQNPGLADLLLPVERGGEDATSVSWNTGIRDWRTFYLATVEENEQA